MVDDTETLAPAADYLLIDGVRGLLRFSTNRAAWRWVRASGVETRLVNDRKTNE